MTRIPRKLKKRMKKSAWYQGVDLALPGTDYTDVYWVRWERLTVRLIDDPYARALKTMLLGDP